MAPQPVKKLRGGLLGFICSAFIVGGVLCLLYGLLGAFVRLWTSAASPAWSFIVLVLIIFEGVLMISAGLSGRQAGSRSGPNILGPLVLSIALGWLTAAIVGGAGPWWIPLLVVIGAILYLTGLRNADRPPAPPENGPDEESGGAASAGEPAAPGTEGPADTVPPLMETPPGEEDQIPR